MTGQRNHSLASGRRAAVVGLGLTLVSVAVSVAASVAPVRAATPEILLPDPLAVELPANVADFGADDAPLRDLIAKVKVDGYRVTATLPRDRIGVGVWYVIWSAWDPNAPDHPAARRESFLFVLPHGMTPVGASGGGNATAGNNTTHIARDAGGSIHMVWYNSWRPGYADGARYRRARIADDGHVEFETDVMPLAVHAGTWSSMPTLIAVGNTVHFAWQADGTVHYRSLARDGTAWRWSDGVDTRASSPGRDTGASIAADSNGVHLLTPAGIYTTSTDGGRTWTSEPVPLAAGEHIKTASLSLDNQGRPLAAASSVVSSPEKYSEDVGHGGYWTIRLFRRMAPGKWDALPSPVDGRPEWAAPAQQNQDVLCDWVRVMGDGGGGIHMTWHGTAVSRIYGNDRAYYSWRSPEGVWSAPASLHEPDPARGFGFSYAPGLTLDGDRALALVFYNMKVGGQDRGFDSDLNLFRDGHIIAAPLPVTRFARESIVMGEPENALSAWFPSAAPSLVRGADGKVWADVLLALAPTGVSAPNLIVLDHLDLTAWLKAAGQ